MDHTRVSSSVRRWCRSLSSSSSSSSASTITKQALVLWIGDDDDTVTGAGGTGTAATTNPRHLARRHPLLVPSQQVIEHGVLSDDAWALVDLVEAHYSRREDDVGGMGESDQGVWFAGVGDFDVLDHILLIQEAIQAIQEHRHGIPFRLYSSGQPATVVPWEAMPKKKCTLQISLFAPTPKEYVKWTGGKQKDFTQVCGLIATAAESMPVEIGVLQEYEAPAQSLASSLGARAVFAYSPEDYVHVLETN
jgi:hypothetical protein